MLRLTLRFAAATIMLCAATFSYAATLTLVSSDPPNNAANISRTDTTTLTFSAAVSPSSVNSTNVKLQSATGIQPASLTVSGATVSVRPKNPLTPWTSYKLNAQSLVGTNGDQLATPVSLTFKTRDGAWQSPQLLYQLAPGQWNPVTRSNAKGVRFILWLQTNASGGDDIWAMRQLPGKPAEAPTLVKSYPYNVFGLNVFIDDDGNAMASWVVERAGNGTTLGELLRVSRFLAGTGSWAGWGTPQNLDFDFSESGENSGAGLKIVFDHAGNALAVWSRYLCCAMHEQQTIMSNRYTRALGWRGPTVVDDNAGFLGAGIELQMDDAGNAYAAWSTGGLPYTVPPKIAHYTTNVGWNAPQSAGPYQPNNTAWQLALAVSSKGEALLMWPDSDGLNYVRTDSSGNLNTPHLVNIYESNPPVSMALLNDDRAFAVFPDGVSQFVPATNSWSSIHPLLPGQSVPLGAVSDAQIVADAAGNAIVAWTQLSNGINRIYAKRYRANYGWLAASPIDTGDTLGAQLQQLLLEPTGSAVASWLQKNDIGTWDVKSARFE